MNVTDFSESLLGFTEAVQELQRQQSPDHPDIEVRIRTTRDGSFIAEITLAHSSGGLAHQLASADAFQLTTGLATLASTFYLVVEEVKRRKGWPVRKTALAQDEVEIEWPDGTAEVVSRRVSDALTSRPIRMALLRWIQPARGGIRRIRARIGTQRETSVEAGDIGAFEVIGDPVQIDTYLDDATLDIRAVALDPSEKWRVLLRGQSAWVRIEDQRFVERVAAGEIAFAEGDKLVVQLSTTVLEDVDGGKSYEHNVIRVIDHQHPPKTRHLWDEEA